MALYNFQDTQMRVPVKKQGCFYRMFIREKNNSGGIVRVQVIDKCRYYMVVRAIGSSSENNTIEEL